MKKSILGRVAAAFMSAVTAASIAFAVPQKEVRAAQANWNFDLGANAQSGYTSVSAADAYNSSKGYGFRNTSGVKNVSASGSGALSDAVQFTDTANANNTFDVDLPKGLYRVTVVLGNTNRTSIHMENMLQIVNMTGNNATDSILIPVTDGQLNIRATEGKAGYAFTISSIKIEQVSTDPTLPPTVWMCGDSTVCNYYPLDTSVQAGWGQVLNKFIDTSKWQVRNMAASGQYAKGFVEAGQFTAIEYYGKPGDKYIISIGINDTNYSNAEEYTNYVTDMAKKAMAKGMEVILVKQQGRNGDATRKPLLTGRWFGGQLDQIGKELGLQVVDLFTPWQDHCISIGTEATTALYMNNDTLHPNRQGAMKLAEFAAAQINWDTAAAPSKEGAEIAEDKTYLIKNVNSGLYLTAEKAENAANVSQQKGTSLDGNVMWTVKKADDGYYYVYSALEGGNKYLLDLYQGSAANGANIGIYTNTKSDAQLFKFIKNDDGSYVIATKVTSDKSCVEVIGAKTDPGSNVQEWEINGHKCQSWTLEPVTLGETTDEIKTGDVNRDGIINVFDYIMVKRLALNSDNKDYAKYRNGDTNADGEFDKTDCEAISKYVIKAQDVFEADEKCRSFYYAKEATFVRGIHENTNEGFKKDQYVNLDNITGSFLHWNVYAPEDGNYYCAFSVANGSNINRVMKIEVNGAEDYWLQDFLPTGAWTAWDEKGIVLPFKKGLNDLRMTSNVEQGGPNIDTLSIEKTDEPIAETYIPPKQDEPTVNDNPTIHIAGDSTVQTYRASYAPQQGWGAYLADYLSDNVTVSNHALAGRSSKSFYDEGRLDSILNDMKSGDYLLVQFGINDSASSKPERYAPTCGKIPGDDGSFEYYIAKYIEGAKAKGATPVLVTTTIGLKSYSNGKFTNSYQNYCGSMKQLAAHYKIPCIDLNSLMVDHYNAIGYDAAYQYHMCSTGSTDMTHFTETGANAVAKLVADDLIKQTDIKGK